MVQKSGATVSFGGFIVKGATLSNAGNSVVANFRAQSGRGEVAETFDCALWGKRAEALAPYLKQRMPVHISGYLGRSEYQGSTTLTCNVLEIALLSNLETLERERQHHIARREAKKQQQAQQPELPHTQQQGKRNVIAEGGGPNGDDVIDDVFGGRGDGER